MPMKSGADLTGVAPTDLSAFGGWYWVGAHSPGINPIPWI